MIDKFFFLTGLFLLFALGAFCQERESIEFNVFANPFRPSNQNFINNLNRTEDVDDKQFYFNEWSSLELVALDSSVVKIESANYHIPTGQIVFYRDDSILELYPDKVIEVNFNNVVFKSFFVSSKKKRRKDSNPLEKSFFEVLFDGDNLKLLRKLKLKKVRPRSNHPMGLTVNSNFETELQEELFVSKNNSREIIKLPKSKKAFSKLFTGKKSVMVKYASENDLNHKIKNDIVTLFKFYESLL